jgi:hypothetical protein
MSRATSRASSRRSTAVTWRNSGAGLCEQSDRAVGGVSMDHSNDADGLFRLSRRDIIRAAGATIVAGGGAVVPAARPASAQKRSSSDELPLGSRLQGVQHFGLTVQRMDRAFEFYTEVLGGTEIMRDGDFHGKRSITRSSRIKKYLLARARSIHRLSECRTCGAARSGSTSALSSSTTSS